MKNSVDRIASIFCCDFYRHCYSTNMWQIRQGLIRYLMAIPIRLHRVPDPIQGFDGPAI